MIKWVVRFAFITGLLGLAGTIVIIYSLHRKHEDKKILKEKNQRELPVKNPIIDTGVIYLPSNQADTLIAAKPAAAKKNKDTAVAILPSPAKIEKKVISKPAPVIKEGRKPEAELKDAKKLKKQNRLITDAEEKLFTNEELQQLVARINTKKEVNNLYSNCVQIYSTVEGNNKRTIAQIETYLKSRRFAIAGREVISKKVKGIQISSKGDCIRITIGTF